MSIPEKSSAAAIEKALASDVTGDLCAEIRQHCEKLNEIASWALGVNAHFTPGSDASLLFANFLQATSTFTAALYATVIDMERGKK